MSETTTVTLADFLLARIAEDETLALAARDASPEYGDEEGSYYGPDGSAFGEFVEMSTNEGTSQIVAAHVAHWNPARTLAEREAKRRIVSLHVRSGEHEPGHVPGYFCETCADWSLENDEGQPPTVPWPCPTLRALAAIYADHPDYRSEWVENDERPA